MEMIESSIQKMVFVVPHMRVAYSLKYFFFQYWQQWQYKYSNYKLFILNEYRNGSVV